MYCYCLIFLLLVSSFYFSPLSLPLCLPLYPLLFLLLTQGSCAADLYRHPQLDADIEAVKEVYSENSVSVRWDSTSEMAVDKPLLSELLKDWIFFYGMVGDLWTLINYELSDHESCSEYLTLADG